ncbi:MAG TPA: hypothetical protein VEZ72_20585, partial [Paenibacillus sp.]|nr:hypothetical protein [Paenibacillus sp.]
MRRRLLRAGALAALAIAAAGAPGCERESNVGHQDSRVSVEQEQSSIPVPTGVLSIEVFEGVDGEASSIRIDDGATVDRLTAGLREGAKPSYIDDPEPSGQLYRVDMRGVDAAGTPYTFTFTLNDMTGTDALQDAVKLYLAREDGATAAWTVPSGWALELLGRAAYGERRLRIAAIPHSGSVAVQANRRIRTASAPAAIEETLQFAGLEPDEQAPEYKIHWSDPQRFVVRFEPLPDGTAVRFRLDGLATAEGETFANEAEPRLTAATLTSASAWGGLSQADADGTVERSGRLGEAVLIGPLTGDGTDAVLAYGADGMNTLFDLGTGTTRTLPAISWPDEASPPFGNDYGADVLFADRMNGDSVYA